ncbi:MAG: hydroxyethylthiazole kinase [Proteobacteria bacterium]|nr:hydroxyethylthiazole kinase [Pseudomonadota bacterium]
MLAKIAKVISDIKQQKPLILNLTNFVTMDFVANCLLALGAAPIMSVCKEEMAELISLCSVLYINIGTLDAAFIALINQAVKLAVHFNKPLLLDPVGAGATKIRTQIAKDIAPCSTIIRGNASEILALGAQAHLTKGVESTHTTDDAKEIASVLAYKYKTTVMVSGAIDFITDQTNSSQVAYGSALMQKVTGMGCAMTAIIAAFKAVLADSFEACVAGAHYFDLCGEIASQNNPHPGSFRSAFIDQLHIADFALMKKIYDQRAKS